MAFRKVRRELPLIHDGKARTPPVPALNPGHDLTGVPAGAKCRSHHTHRRVDVPEEVLVALAQVMQPRLAVGGGREAVLRAAAMAREPDIALPAVDRQLVPFGVAERLLLR
jgi:hypothetical protein